MEEGDFSTALLSSRVCHFVGLLLNFVPKGTKTSKKTFGEMSVFSKIQA